MIILLDKIPFDKTVREVLDETDISVVCTSEKGHFVNIASLPNADLILVPTSRKDEVLEWMKGDIPTFAPLVYYETLEDVKGAVKEHLQL